MERIRGESVRGVWASFLPFAKGAKKHLLCCQQGVNSTPQLWFGPLPKMVHIERVSPNKSACGHFIQSFLETCKDGESHLNSYKICFFKSLQTLAKEMVVTQIAIKSAFQAAPEMCKEGESQVNSSQIYFLGLSRDTQRSRESRK